MPTTNHPSPSDKSWFLQFSPSSSPSSPSSLKLILSKEALLAIAFAALITFSYFCLASSPSTIFYHSFFPLRHTIFHDGTGNGRAPFGTAFSGKNSSQSSFADIDGKPSLTEIDSNSSSTAVEGNGQAPLKAGNVEPFSTHDSNDENKVSHTGNSTSFLRTKNKGDASFNTDKNESSFHSTDDDEANLELYQRTIEDVFKKASMSSRTVILTTLNAAWAEKDTMVDMFLESFQHGEGTQKLLQHLIIVCLDQKAYERCLEIHSHCLKIKTGGINFAGEQLLLSEEYIKMIWRRIKFLKTVLEMDYSFIFTDTDILWFRDPFPLLLKNADDFQIACDRFNGRPLDVRNKPNAGFTFVRANEKTVKFYEYWYNERSRGPKLADQEVFNLIKQEGIFQKIGMSVRFLDTQYFGGFCGIRFTDMNKALTMHATCCKGLSNKLHDLRIILDGWKGRKQVKSQGKSSSTQSTSMLDLETSNVRQEQNIKRSPIPLVTANISSGLDVQFQVPQTCLRSIREH